MFYTAETGRQHATTFFNRTIDIVEPHTWVDFQAIFLVVLILAGIGGLGVLPRGLKFFRAREHNPQHDQQFCANTYLMPLWCHCLLVYQIIWQPCTTPRDSQGRAQ